MKRTLSLILCCLIVILNVVPASAASAEAQTAADTLYGLGLFSGTGVDQDGAPIYRLDQTLSRQEAITMILSLTGKTEEARKTVSKTHFLDVDPWAAPYVGYAYQQGITAGVSADRFGAHQNVTAAEYLTFLLSCLGYRAEQDFVWNKTTVLTNRIGITHDDYADARVLTRGDAVLLSERALHAKCKNSAATLAESFLALSLDEALALPSDVADSWYFFNISSVSAYSGTPYVVLNQNVPSFTAADLSYLSFESYSPLDPLGRCGEAFACLGTDLMPTASRESIGQIRPSGWHTVRYDDLIADKYLYNRCHLIGYQLTAENANEKNLITGTRYMNTEGMEPVETVIANYIRRTGNHVLYRVTPIFEGKNLVASGVHLEALSEEDAGKGVKYNLFFYNVQPGIEIDYATGDSQRAAGASALPAEEPQQERDPGSGVQPGAQAETYTYIVNINPSSKKIHLPWCPSVAKMNESNKWYTDWTLEQLLDAGYTRCKNCNP
ncbi:MAG: DNA/RNA non-specific endonuclease [Firmicutes bacterium]|nr:DNA/RNA non-specific endonuclease [Bacillota bacterium]